MKISVADILGHPGEYRDLKVASELEGVEVALARLDPQVVRGKLRAESVVEGILVTGRLEAATALECSRCLESFSGRVDAEVCELFVAPGHERGADDDAYPVEGSEIDLEPMVRDAVALALPLKPLCTEACKGLCATCGKPLDHECLPEEPDPRWAGLAALRDRLED